MKLGTRVRVKPNVPCAYSLAGKTGYIAKDTTNIWNWVRIGGSVLCFRESELETIEHQFDLLRSYALRQKLVPVRREDGTLYFLKGNREIYSIIKDYGGTYETWDYTNGMRGVHRGRNLESVKRSLRRIRARKG